MAILLLNAISLINLYINIVKFGKNTGSGIRAEKLLNCKLELYMSNILSLYNFNVKHNRNTFFKGYAGVHCSQFGVCDRPSS